MSTTHLAAPTARQNRTRIPRLIWGFAILLLVLLWTAILYKVTSEKQLEIADINQTNINLARSLEEHTLRTLKSVDQAVLFLKFQYERNHGKVDIQDYAHEGMIITTLFNQLGVIDEHGMYILSNIPNHKVMDLSDREHFLVHKKADTNQLFISKPVLGRASGKWSIQMTRRINKPDGSFGGVVVVSVDPYYFTGLYGDVNLGKDGVIALVGLDGVVRARKSGENADVGQNIGDSAVFKLLADANQGIYERASKIDHINRFLAFRRLPDYPLVVIVGVSADEALGDFYARRQSYIAFAIVMTLLILAFAISSSRLLNQLNRSREEAEEANRLKSEFLASMSHELRTPLNGIIGYAELLQDSVDDQSLQGFAGTILDSGNHLLGLVNSILDQSKIEAGRLELFPSDVDCRALLQQIYLAHLPTAQQKGLEFELAVDDDAPPTLRCDNSRLMQVLNNLVHNALKFTDQGRVELRARRAPGGIRFSVIDTGPGIAPEHHGIIFEKFRQAETFITRKHGGTGLGLSLSRQLVELMGGRLELHSALGQGSEFYFTLGDLPAGKDSSS
ncbi:sensor histidine kinase [Oryzomicrobium sp.]|uniref:sensor histidine kinase n=1 Tax=Oryzomicrobium sp. TaxID=1911578 RepID=UPI002FDFA75B